MIKHFYDARMRKFLVIFSVPFIPKTDYNGMIFLKTMTHEDHFVMQNILRWIQLFKRTTKIIINYTKSDILFTPDLVSTFYRYSKNDFYSQFYYYYIYSITQKQKNLKWYISKYSNCSLTTFTKNIDSNLYTSALPRWKDLRGMSRFF